MSIFRHYQIDLKKYLPQFLFKDAKLKALFDAETKEHERQEAALKDIFKQFFVETATWGLTAWERNLDLTSSPNDTYKQRRNRIYLKLQSRQTSTKKFMRDLAARYFKDGAEIEAVEDNPNDMFWIRGNGADLLYLDDLIDAIDTYIPAHLGLGLFIREILENTDFRFGITSSTFDAAGLYPPIMPDKTDAEKNIYISVPGANIDKMGIYPSIVPDKTDGAKVIYIGAAMSYIDTVSLYPSIMPDDTGGEKAITGGSALSNLDTVTLYPPIMPDKNASTKPMKGGSAVTALDKSQIYPPIMPDAAVQKPLSASNAIASKDAISIYPPIMASKVTTKNLFNASSAIACKDKAVLHP